MTQGPAGTLRQQQKERTRALILDTARNLFEANGFDKTTIRMVATEAGIGLGTISGHFADKTSLLAASLYDGLEQTLAELLAAFPQDAPICDQFLHLARGFYQNYARRPDLSKVLIKEILFISGEWGEILDRQLERFLTLLTQLIEDAREKGEIRPDADCQQVASIFFSHYMSTLVWHFRAPEFDPEAALGTLAAALRITMAGIAAPGKDSP